MKIKNLFMYLSVIIATLGATSIQAAMFSKPEIICSASQLFNELASACHLSQSNPADAQYIKLLNDCITANAEKDGTISTYNIQAIALSLILQDVKTRNDYISAFLKHVINLIYSKYFPDKEKCKICKKHRSIIIQLPCNHTFCAKHLNTLTLTVNNYGECPIKNCTARIPQCLKNVFKQLAEEKDKQILNKLVGLLVLLNLLTND